MSLVESFPAPVGASSEPRGGAPGASASSVRGKRASQPRVELDIEHGASWELVAPREDFERRSVALRVLAGVALSAFYGLALGARDGGAALLWDALSMPAAVLCVVAVAVPALFIGFAFLDAPIDPERMANVTGRAVATLGLVLAGLAPAAALFAVTTEGRAAAVLIATVGLAVAAFTGFRVVLRDIGGLLLRAPLKTQLLGMVMTLVFGAFAVLLTGRVLLSMNSLFAIGGGL